MKACEYVRMLKRRANRDFGIFLFLPIAYALDSTKCSRDAVVCTYVYCSVVQYCLGFQNEFRQNKVANSWHDERVKHKVHCENGNLESRLSQ